MRAQAQLDTFYKRRSAVNLHRLTKDELPPIQSTVLSVAQLDHFVTTCEHGVWHSLPVASSAEVKTFAAFFSSAQSLQAGLKRKRALGQEDKMILDIDSAANDGKMFFKLAVVNLGRKKFMKVAAGAGRKLSRTDLTIVMSRPFDDDTQPDPAQPILVDSTRGQKSADALCVLSHLGDPDVAYDQLLKWDGHCNILELARTKLLQVILLRGGSHSAPLRKLVLSSVRVLGFIFMSIRSGGHNFIGRSHRVTI